MKKIDIRSTGTEKVETIIFADDSYGYATQISRYSDTILFADCDGDNETAVASSSIDNLILALQKAKELGWK